MSIENFIWLASGSPRRRELVGLTGLTFRVWPADLDETQQPGESPSDYVHRLAEEKARAVSAQAGDGSLILAADTIVVDHGEVLGKPSDRDEAVLTLRRLRGRIHQVHTAIAVLRGGQQLLTDVCVTDVPMRAYSEAEIQAYVDSGDPFDKAGAYAIQNGAFHPVSALTGCYANVVGLPLCHLVRTLAQLERGLAADVPQRCQQHLGYNCPVYRQVLAGASGSQEKNEPESV
ncbi:MAG: Maf family protein [Anaerolineales bacterium]